MNELLSQLKDSFDNLSAREKRLVAAMGVIFGALVLCLPLVLMNSRNSDLQDENDALRAVLAEIAKDGPKYAMLAEERRQAKARYLNKTPALGSFLESEASKQGLDVKEFTDQPQKKEGSFVKRNVRVSLPNVALTPVMNLLSSVVTSNYPVAIEQIQIEHYRNGDQYNVKLGVLTYDRMTADKSSDKQTKAKSAESEPEEN